MHAPGGGPLPRGSRGHPPAHVCALAAPARPASQGGAALLTCFLWGHGRLAGSWVWVLELICISWQVPSPVPVRPQVQGRRHRWCKEQGAGPGGLPGHHDAACHAEGPEGSKHGPASQAPAGQRGASPRNTFQTRSVTYTERGAPGHPLFSGPGLPGVRGAR